MRWRRSSAGSIAPEQTSLRSRTRRGIARSAPSGPSVAVAHPEEVHGFGGGVAPSPAARDGVHARVDLRREHLEPARGKGRRDAREEARACPPPRRTPPRPPGGAKGRSPRAPAPPRGRARPPRGLRSPPAPLARRYRSGIDARNASRKCARPDPCAPRRLAHAGQRSARRKRGAWPPRGARPRRNRARRASAPSTTSSPSATSSRGRRL